MIIRTALSILAFATLLNAQTGTATNFGRGCNLPSNPPPLIRALSTPSIGTTMEVRFTGPNSVTPVSEDQPVLITGLQQVAIPVPNISPLQQRILRRPDDPRLGWSEVGRRALACEPVQTAAAVLPV